MFKLQYVGIGFLVLMLSGCSAATVTRSVAPVIEPPLDTLPSLTLADSEGDIQNYATGNSRAIELAGLVNVFRGQSGLPLASWDQRLYELALQRAKALALSDRCWTAQTGCDRAETLAESARSLGYAAQGALLESAYITVGRSLDLERSARAWQQASGHRENLLFHDIGDIGVAIVGVGEMRVYVLILGRE